MSDKHSIEAAFARANVPLEISERSINRRLIRGGGQIVQMGIMTNRQGDEWISMNIPDEDGVEVKALGADPDHQQVVLMVHERARKVVEERVNWRTGEKTEHVIKVPEGKRRFLVGMDESHLFIAQMPNSAGATSVKQAHKDLRPKEVPASRKKQKKAKIRRTGEWFLIPATPEEIERIEGHIKLYGVRKKVGIGSHLGRMRGRPHVVSESVAIGHKTQVERVSRWMTSTRTVEPGTEFVRGRIIHPDHKVVKLKTWHRVVMNTENRSVGAQWVD